MRFSKCVVMTESEEDGELVFVPVEKVIMSDSKFDLYMSVIPPDSIDNVISFTDYPFFICKEFECKCGCGLNNISEDFVSRLSKAREIAGIPFIINSACRCETHNKNIGGVVNSSHLKGLAVDIKALTSIDKYKIVSALMSVGFKRILLYKTFIHCDMDYSKINPILKIM